MVPRKIKISGPQRGLIHAEEIDCVLPVLDGCILGPEMRESLEPNEPRSVDLPGNPDRNILWRQYVRGAHDEHDRLIDS